MPPSVVRFVRELRMGCVSSAGDSVPHEQRGVESGADFFRQGRFAFPCPYRKVRLSFFSYTYSHLELTVNLPLLTIPQR
jgi:hypothetical protein